MWQPIVAKALVVAASSMAVVSQTQDDSPQAKYLSFGATEIQAVVDRELRFARIAASLSQGTIDQLREALKPAVLTEVQRLRTDPLTKSWSKLDAGRAPLSPRLRNELEDVCGSLLDKAQLAVVLRDAGMRSNMERSRVIAGFVRTVDAEVLLRSNQVPEIEALAETLFTRGQLPDGSSLASNGWRSTALDPDLKPILSPLQMSAWRKRSPTSRSTFGRVPPKEELENRTQALRDKLNTVVAMRIHWLVEELQLSPAQEKRLRVAAKGAMTDAIRRQLALEKPAIADLSDGSYSSRTVAILNKPAHRMLDESRWRQLVAVVLTDEQDQRLARVDEEWEHRFREFFAGEFARMLAAVQFKGGPELRGTHMQSLENLMRKTLQGRSMKSNRHWIDLVEFLESITQIPAVDYARSVGADNWSRLKPAIDSFRPQIESLKQER